MSKIKWTDEEIKIIKTYYETEGADIQKRLPGRDYSTIKRKANKLGIYTKRIIRPKGSYIIGQSKFNKYNL